jgi:hypothetical protein
MVRIISVFAFLFLLASCDVYYVEPRYDVRDELVGRYDIEEFSATYNDVTRYTFRIEKAGYSGNEIYIKNFYGVGIRVKAFVSYDRIDIPRQVIDGYEIDGVGTIFNSEISLNYRVVDLYSNAPADFCETTAWL